MAINITTIPSNIGGISVPDALRGPLSSLYGPGKYDTEIIRYPRDLGSNQARKHSIVFTVKKADPAQLTGLIEAAKTVPDAIAGGIQDVVDTVFNTAKNAGKGLDTAFDTVAGGAVNTISNTGDRLKPFVNELSNQTLKLRKTPGPTIGLYVPDTVNVAYSTGYDADVSLSDALGKFYFLAQGATSIAESFKNQEDRTLTNAINKAGNDPFIRELALRTVGKRTGVDITQLGLNAGGYAMNPQLQVLFKGIGFRSFQFDFMFTPHNKEEADAVKRIIYLFKYHSAPQIDRNGLFEQGMYMKVPDAFDIKFYYGNQENRNVHRIGECVLENINVDYAGSGQWSTFNDGQPNQIRMTLQFKETVIIDKNRINQGY